MGYTHSWYRLPHIKAPAMASIRKDFEKVIAELSVENAITEITLPYLKIGENDIIFAGLTGNSEPFIFMEKSNARRVFGKSDSDPWKEGLVFEFCKTAHTPHDLPVTAALIVIKRQLGTAIRIFTDGDDADWVAAKSLCQKAVGYGFDFAVKGRELDSW